MTNTHGNADGKRQLAIIALLSEPTLEGAARKAGISDTTLYRLLKDSSFVAEYREARREALGQAVAQLQANGSKAGKALVEIIENKKAPAMARVRAIEVLFEYSLRSLELDDLGARLEKLEKAQAQSSGSSSDEWSSPQWMPES